MMKLEILEASDRGREIRHIPTNELTDIIRQQIENLDGWGVNFEDLNTKHLASRMKEKYPWMKDSEISLILWMGLESEFTKRPPKNMTLVDFWIWLKEYTIIKQKVEMERNEFNLSDLTDSANLEEIPYSYAMSFKYSEALKIRDSKDIDRGVYEKWKDIPVKELAILSKSVDLTRDKVMKHFNIK